MLLLADSLKCQEDSELYLKDRSVQTVYREGAGIAQLVVLGLAAKVSRVRYSSGDVFRYRGFFPWS